MESRTFRLPIVSRPMSCSLESGAFESRALGSHEAESREAMALNVGGVSRLLKGASGVQSWDPERGGHERVRAPSGSRRPTGDGRRQRWLQAN